MNKLDKAIKAIFNINLNIKKNEKLLVFTDLIQPDESISNADRVKREDLIKIAKRVLEVGKEICNVEFAAYPSLKENGIEPPEDIWIKAFGKDSVEELNKNDYLQRLRNKDKEPAYLKEVEGIIRKYKGNAVNAVIALSNFSTSHTKFRDLLCAICGTRYASMPLFEEEMFYGPMDVDWNKLADRTKKLADILNQGKEVLIKTPNGTDVKMKIQGRIAKADTGLLTEPGSFSNLPAGEAFLAPLEGTTNGKLVLEWAPTYKMDSPITLIVKDGKVEDVLGGDFYRDILLKKLDENSDFRNIAELGIGTNDKAKRPDNILESEKILGTIHIALGDNSSFGGNVRTPFHQDFVFFEPTVVVRNDKEGITILDKGRLMIS